MHRRDFLKGSSAALGLGATTLAAATSAKAADDTASLAAPAVIPQRRTLRMLSLWPDAVTGPGDHVRRLARRIEAATDGRWTIEIADGHAATSTDIFKAVMTGDADLYVGHENAHRDLHPAFAYFAGLPCRTGMEIDALDAWLIAAGGQDLWDVLSAEFNMKGLVIGHSGPAHGLYTRQPIETRADLHGKRIAIDGLAADVLKAVDAHAVERRIDPIADMIADATLDGAECSGPLFAIAPAQAVAFHRAAPYRLLPGLNDTGHAFTVGLRRSLWDGLAASERIMLGALASEALASSRADRRAELRNIALMDQLAMKTTHHVHPLEWGIVTNELARIAETIVADLASHDVHARRINASYMAFKGHTPLRSAV